MKRTETSTRHWTERVAPPFLAILATEKAGVNPSPKPRNLKTHLLQTQLTVANFFLWPFDWGYIPAQANTADSPEKLRQKIQKLGQLIEACTNEYITPIHCGMPFPGWGKSLPECPITIEAEAQFVQRLHQLTVSYGKTRPSRKQAVLRKISHADITWWGIVYGAWPGTANQWTVETLSWEEIADLFDVYCYGECESHTPEQVRKIIARRVAEVCSALPSLSYEESHTASQEIPS